MYEKSAVDVADRHKEGARYQQAHSSETVLVFYLSLHLQCLSHASAMIADSRTDLRKVGVTNGRY